jgi:hypothetical protein
MTTQFFRSVGHRRSSGWVVRVMGPQKQLPLDLVINRPIINTRIQVCITVKIYFVQKEPSVLLIRGQHFSFQMATSVYSIINATRLAYFVLMIIHNPLPSAFWGQNIFPVEKCAKTGRNELCNKHILVNSTNIQDIQ